MCSRRQSWLKPFIKELVLTLERNIRFFENEIKNFNNILDAFIFQKHHIIH